MKSLSIITRHLPNRPRLFAAHMASLDAQQDTDFEQIILRGMPTMEAAQIELRTTEVSGRFVWVLDDDDLAAPDAVMTILDNLTTGTQAALFQFNHGQLLPPAGMEELREGYCGVSALVVNRDVWNATRQNFGARYAGDWDWIASVIDGYNVKRFEICIGAVSAANNGGGE